MPAAVRPRFKTSPRSPKTLLLEAFFDINAGSHHREREVIQRSRDAVLSRRQVFLEMKRDIDEWSVRDAILALGAVAAEARLATEERRCRNIADVERLIPISNMVSYFS